MRKFLLSIAACLMFLLLVGWFVFGNNPYNSFTRIQNPYQTKVVHGQIVLREVTKLQLLTGFPFNTIAFVQSGVRIVLNAFLSEKPFSGLEQAIITQIHEERFDPTKPYIISGGHFADMYPRNMGIFYGSILDGCIPDTKIDWENRQRITLQTVAFDLVLSSQVKDEVPTTFMPIWNNTYVPVQIYTRSSDSLYGILYTLNALQHDQFHSLYKANTICQLLQTTSAAAILQKQYSGVLQTLLQKYYSYTIAPTTGLIKTTITLSSARDGVKRKSSFYDNVIAWKTLSLADQMGIWHTGIDYAAWKQRIITTFWDEQKGIFKDDLSSHGDVFSADSFIVLQTGFLDVQNANDRKKLIKMIAYVQKYKLDKPLPLAYSTEDPTAQLYPYVSIAAPSYMGKSIWSHWGIEYIKTLVALTFAKPQYKDEAQKYIALYSQEILKNGGYPELYATNGSLFRQLFYTSVLHTGWVINYEEAKALLQDKEKVQQK